MASAACPVEGMAVGLELGYEVTMTVTGPGASGATGLGGHPGCATPQETNNLS